MAIANLVSLFNPEKIIFGGGVFGPAVRFLDAIYAEDDVPPDQQTFKALNAELSKVWKPIIERKPAPPDADERKTVKPKLEMLER